jgi:hypothetical protein
MCLNDLCLKQMNDKLRAGFVLNYLFQEMEIVNWLSMYETNMRIFSRSLNELAIPEDSESSENGQNNGLE